MFERYQEKHNFDREILVKKLIGFKRFFFIEQVIDLLLLRKVKNMRRQNVIEIEKN